MTNEDRWRAFVESIPAVRDIRHPTADVRPRDDATAEYESLLDDMPSDIAGMMESARPVVDNATPPDSRTAVWCFADMPDGDFPRVYSYLTLQGMLAALAKREGSDTAVWPFYGFPFRLTRLVTGPDGQQARYLQLDMTTAVRISESSDIYATTMTQLGPVDFEDNGWLGDQTLPRSQYFLEPFVEAGEDAGEEFTDEESE